MFFAVLHFRIVYPHFSYSRIYTQTDIRRCFSVKPLPEICFVISFFIQRKRLTSDMRVRFNLFSLCRFVHFCTDCFYDLFVVTVEVAEFLTAKKKMSRHIQHQGWYFYGAYSWLTVLMLGSGLSSLCRGNNGRACGKADSSWPRK